MGTFAKTCPLCGCGPEPSRRDVDELINQYVNAESYAEKWVSIDVPVDMLIGDAVDAKNFLYKCCKYWNENKKSAAKFNLNNLKGVG